MAGKTSPVSGRKTRTTPTSLFQRSEEETAVEPEHSETVKKTFHLEPEVVLLLSEIQTDDLRRTGKKPALSGLVGEAVRLLGAARQAPAEDQTATS